MKDNILYIGEKKRMQVTFQPMGELTADDYDYTIELYCTPAKKFVITKAEVIRESENVCRFILDTSIVGGGELKMKITALIPDEECEDGVRPDIFLTDTGYRIANC